MNSMKTVVVLVSAIALLLTVPAQTQEIRPDEARDKVFGWMKIYDFKAATEPMTVDHRVYSIAQLSVADNFANWIQQSYVPVGGLGDVVRFVSEKLTAGPGHQVAAAKLRGHREDLHRAEVRRRRQGRARIERPYCLERQRERRLR